MVSRYLTLTLTLTLTIECAQEVPCDLPHPHPHPNQEVPGDLASVARRQAVDRKRRYTGMA